MKIEIRPFTDLYRDGVVDVILPIQKGEFKIPITLEAQPDLLDIPGAYQKDQGNFWVALAGEEVVGTIAIIDLGNGVGALRKMFVKDAFRGREQGVADMLLSVLLDWCGNKGFRDIFLGTTEKFLAAHRFYEKNGFSEVAKRALPSRFPVMEVDTRFYHYPVDS
ncbi:MAG: GNAT family N-acetyltransferase [Desulfobacterales bacterium]|nr:GNAT family N-acetyltransferase [Desulfobacterales bacterium]